ncbi:hypothetical protein DLM78_10370 [Leptospira stimsonii]|uniref:Uncharacterized protein n=1 Tax=Leptospira stimsonii TaxID=2202203 RepID=A0A8B3CR57_9LEPT|nr:hypothetical protein DLM78_10370 [Leptospira stimsonii]
MSFIFKHATNEVGFSTFAVLERAKRAEELERGSSDISRGSRTESQSECAEGQARVALAIPKHREKPQLGVVAYRLLN